ncbi:hypothetical protein ABW19_dt0206311 [Dactylella cylindrospora]|nr:hypothetical protein ABW19_dt0206311 [Dactylella cylindrospora]
MEPSPTSLPVYFISHGGPPIMEWTQHPAYKALTRFGSEVTALKPKGLVVLSAHFSGGSDEILINQGEITDLIYDFYGFPRHYYQKQFRHSGSSSMAQEISTMLSSANIRSRMVKRGLDHGIWVPFSIAFDPEKNPLTVPIVQISLFASENAEKHIALGKAIAPLRERGYIIICSGQAVHNLRDLDFDATKPLPYVGPFDRALEDAMTSGTGDGREAKMLQLLKRRDARAAHPHFDHIIPIYVAIGAASDAVGRQLFNHQEGSLGWAQYKLSA